MMGKLNYSLGFQIKQVKNGIFINKFKYCKEHLKKFDMDKCKKIATPISSRTYVDQDESWIPIDKTKYQCMIGSLVYLTTSGPDIMFSVCLCACYR